jgi:Chlorophyllase enzyme
VTGRRYRFRWLGPAAAILTGAVMQVACSGGRSAAPPGSDGSQPVSGSAGGSPSGNGGTTSAASGGASGGGGAIRAGGGASGSTGTTSGAGAAAPDAGQRDGGEGGERDAGRETQAADAGSRCGSGGSVGSAPWPAVTDYGAAGFFAPMRVMNTGPSAAYDVFQPTVLGAQGRKHPIISWANGTLYSVDDYEPLLSHWASHGFVVIAGHTNATAGGATLKAGIDWLVAQNGTAGSPYFGVLDPSKIGAAGHSQGGGATIAAGANKPGPTGITVTLPLMPLLSFESDQTIVSRQLVPMFNVNASMDEHDPTGAYASAIYAGAVTELVQAAFIGIHEDAMNVEMHGPTVAWFRWKLMGDVQARAMFYPAASCGLCVDPAWKSVRYKNSPP